MRHTFCRLNQNYWLFMFDLTFKGALIGEKLIEWPAINYCDCGFDHSSWLLFSLANDHFFPWKPLFCIWISVLLFKLKSTFAQLGAICSRSIYLKLCFLYQQSEYSAHSVGPSWDTSGRTSVRRWLNFKTLHFSLWRIFGSLGISCLFSVKWKLLPSLILMLFNLTKLKNYFRVILKIFLLKLLWL